MKIISFWKDYGIRNLSRLSEIEEIGERIKLESECDLELDLSGCLIAYPATSKLIDRIVDHLKAMSGNRSLKIILTSISPEQYVLDDLFKGSKYFKWDIVREGSGQRESLVSTAREIGISLDIREKSPIE